MRVNAGKYKGMVLKSPTSDNVRPTGDKVRQAMFTKLQFFIPEKKVLDLFAGSGAMGIEALSRGASKVVFVDKDKRSISLIKQNTARLVEPYIIKNCDYTVALNTLTEKFDLIFIDPPYASGFYNNALALIKSNNLLNDGGIIVCEHDITTKIESDFNVIDEKKYGSVMLTYLQL